MFKLFLCGLILLTSSLYGQQQYQIIFDPPSGQRAVSTLQAVGGGYIKISNIFPGVLCARLDEQMTVLWTKSTYSGSAISAGQDSTGNIYLLESGFCIVKLDSNFNMLWKQSLTPFPYNDIQMTVTPGGFVYIGSSAPDTSNLDQIYFICIDPSGNARWMKTIPNSVVLASLTYPTASISSFGEKAIISAIYYDLYTTQGCMFELDTLGNVIQIQSNAHTADGIGDGGMDKYALFGFFIGGNIGNCLRVINGNGVQLMEMHYDTDLQSALVIGTQDNGFAIVGKHYSSTYFLKVDSNLVPQWCRDILNADGLQIASLVQTADGYLITGSTNNNNELDIKTDLSGFSGCVDNPVNVAHTSVVGSAGFYNMNPSGLTISNTFLADSTHFYTNASADTLCAAITGLPIPSPGVFMITPIPAQTEICIVSNRCGEEKITIFNFAGEVIYSAILNKIQTLISVESFPSGLYFVSIETENERMTQKLIKQ